MSLTAIPLQFEKYLQNQISVGNGPDMNEMIFAYIPGLDLTQPIDRSLGLPDVSLWVHQQDIDQVGKLGDNALVYSVVIPGSVDAFTFNAIYLRDKNVPNSCGMVVHKADETKEDGMASTKSLMQQYTGAAQIAGINVDAATWQIDYQARLLGIEDDMRLANVDTYGHTAFVDGFEVVQQADPTKYAISPGVAYVGGLRAVLDDEIIQTINTKPNGLYLDVVRMGTALSQWQNVVTVRLSEVALSDNVDGNNQPHYVAKLAGINADGTVADWRVKGGLKVHEAASDPHPQYPLAANTVSGQNATRTTQINEATAQGALMSGFWTVYGNNGLNYYPDSKLQYPIHMIKAAYSVVGNKGGLEILGGDSRTSPLFFRVSTGVGAGTLQQLYSDINPPPVDKVTGAQYAPYSPTRVYKCGEVCSTEIDGIVQFWEWYSNVESLAGKDPSLTANRQDGWEDDTKPYYWMPHKKARAGTPLFPWLSETIPEGTLNVVGNSVPVAVFWRLAEAFPEFVNANTQMIDFPETRGEFFRVLDQGRGFDNGRILGSTQAQSIEHHGIQLMGKGSNDAVSIGSIVHLGRRGTGSDPVGIVGYSGSSPLPNQYYDNYSGTPYGSYSDGDDETRPSNLAFPVLVEV
ncbi:phage tail protein [Vibrio fluvialis]